jgi:hypothetical protein
MIGLPPKLGQILGIGFQVVIQYFNCYIHIGNTRAEQQALQCFLTVTGCRCVDAQAGNGYFTAAQFSHALRQVPHSYTARAHAAENAGHFDDGTSWAGW